MGTVQVVVRQTGADPALARAIRALREQHGLSQEAVARGADLTVSSFARIERGQANPTWLTVSHIADALQISLTELARVVEIERDR